MKKNFKYSPKCMTFSSFSRKPPRRYYELKTLQLKCLKISSSLSLSPPLSVPHSLAHSSLYHFFTFSQSFSEIRISLQWRGRKKNGRWKSTFLSLLVNMKYSFFSYHVHQQIFCLVLFFVVLTLSVPFPFFCLQCVTFTFSSTELNCIELMSFRHPWFKIG